MARKKDKEKIADYKQMEVEELQQALGKIHQDLFKVKFRAATASIKNVMQVRVLRREVARINTFIAQKRRAMV